MAATTNDLFGSLIADIKSYTGKDPLLPWLRGIKKMKESLPSNVLKEKLPRFLQKCAERFESDQRYRNDLRYLRVWLQLMDYVDEPRALLRTMEMKSIGKKRALFYQAYALYYEKMKKFEEADKMYHLGVQNLADPIDELNKSYDQFLQRMERHHRKKNQNKVHRSSRRPRSARIDDKENQDVSPQNIEPLNKSTNTVVNDIASGTSTKTTRQKETEVSRKFHGDDTVVVKFVDTAIVGKPEAEDACHHGLVDPTINMKEAMNAINSMFREPIETAPISRKSKRSQPKEHNPNKGFNVFMDQDSKSNSLQIFIDDDDDDENGDRNADNENIAEGFVFQCPKDQQSEDSGGKSAQKSTRLKLMREDTVVHRFVGSTITDEPEVENVCHHGLVDPTINLKEAMDDINGMFGKPMDFVRRKRPKKQEKAPEMERDFGGGFSILPDDEFESEKSQPPEKSSSSRNNDLFEPTVFTKEAMDDINKLFGMPLDF